MGSIKRLISLIHNGLFYFLIVFTGIIITISSSNVYAQNGETVRGSVTDLSNEPLAGVNVMVKGTSKGTSTDSEGRFLLENVDINSDTLNVSYIGFETAIIPLNGRSDLTITLEESSEALEEVVVVGYGTQSRAEVTTSVGKLDNQVLENVTYDNAATAMQGTISGVRVQQTSGQPGATPRIIVRGGTSINDPDGATPLYVIDGVIRQDMNNISAENIESLQ